MSVFQTLNTQSFGIRLTLAAPLRIPRGAQVLYEGSGRADHMLLYLQRGSIVYHSGGQELLRAQAGDILLLPGGSRYHSTPITEAGISGCFARFLLTDPLGRMISLGEHPQIVLSGGDSDLEQQFTTLARFSLTSMDPLGALQRFAGLLSSLMEAERRRELPGSSITPARQYLHSHLTGPVTLEKLAGLCGMSQRTFCRRFHEVTGEAPLVYHRRLRLEKARELLESGLYTVEKAAECLGFADTAHFSRSFARYMGCRAGEIRAAARKKGE